MKKIFFVVFLLVSVGAMAHNVPQQDQWAFGDGQAINSTGFRIGQSIGKGAVAISGVVVDGSLFVADVVSAPFKASTYRWIGDIF